ncbi:MAG: regulator, partial [Gemmatimonadetes bacterium]|nr:regulator [Gemmatimonadota bacterium]
EAKGTTRCRGGEIGTSVFRSINGGTSWSPLAGGLPSSSYRGFASNALFIVAGAFGGGVFYSKDNGDTWAELNTGLTDKTVFDLVISNGFLMAATNTGGIYRIPVTALK